MKAVEWILRQLRSLGPYLAVELLLPGGSIVALLLWTYRRRTAARATARETAEQKGELRRRVIARTPRLLAGKDQGSDWARTLAVVDAVRDAAAVQSGSDRDSRRPCNVFVFDLDADVALAFGRGKRSSKAAHPSGGSRESPMLRSGLASSSLHRQSQTSILSPARSASLRIIRNQALAA